jgi:hypothetical protein
LILSSQGMSSAFHFSMMAITPPIRRAKNEFVDLGASPAHQDVRRQLHEQLLDRLTDRRNRVTVDDEWIRGVRGRDTRAGIIIGKR